MIRFALGVAVGYVLGTRAGRERFEDLVRMYHRMVDHPAVQGAAGAVRAKVDEKMPWTGHKDEETKAAEPSLAKGQQGDKLGAESTSQQAGTASAKPKMPTPTTRA